MAVSKPVVECRSVDELLFSVGRPCWSLRGMNEGSQSRTFKVEESCPGGTEKQRGRWGDTRGENGMDGVAHLGRKERAQMVRS